MYEHVFDRLTRQAAKDPHATVSLSFDDWLELRNHPHSLMHLGGNARDGFTFNGLRLVLPR